MSFEDKIREKIKKSKINSPERDILKLVLGECQQLTGDLTDKRVGKIIEGIVKANDECLEHLTSEDPRHARFISENAILADLLPKYLTEDQIRERLDPNELKAANNDGQAIGIAMKQFNESGLSVEGGTVKAVVAQMRAS